LKLIVKILIWSGFTGVLTGQTDSVLVEPGKPYKDGLYLKHSDFRKNQPVTKEQIQTEINKDQVEFYYKITTNEKVLYTLHGNSFSAYSNSIWGFVQNGTLFVNYNGIFYRVPLFGSISYFAGVVEVVGYYSGIYDPMFGMGGGRAVKTKEVHEFLMDYYDGKIIGFSVSAMEKMLKRDPEIYSQFKKLSKRNRRKQVSRYIRMYNEKHPLYQLKEVSDTN